MLNANSFSGLTLLRLAVATIFITHAIARIKLGTVGGFGGFLDSQGFSPDRVLFSLGHYHLRIAGQRLADQWPSCKMGLPDFHCTPDRWHCAGAFQAGLVRGRFRPGRHGV